MRDALVGMAALHCALAKKDGYLFDKKCMRYNAMADYMELCGEYPLSGLFDAVSTAIAGSDMHTGAAFDAKSYSWMK